MNPRKAIPKKIREQVKLKFNGDCAYCGWPIPEGKMQIDHLIPLAHAKGTNDIENLMPACSACNNFKMTFGLEEFRTELQNQIWRARKYSVNFRMAEKFGLIKVVQNHVMFHFEKVIKYEENPQARLVPIK